MGKNKKYNTLLFTLLFTLPIIGCAGSGGGGSAATGVTDKVLTYTKTGSGYFQVQNSSDYMILSDTVGTVFRNGCLKTYTSWTLLPTDPSLPYDSGQIYLHGGVSNCDPGLYSNYNMGNPIDSVSYSQDFSVPGHRCFLGLTLQGNVLACTTN